MALSKMPDKQQPKKPEGKAAPADRQTDSSMHIAMLIEEIMKLSGRSPVEIIADEEPAKTLASDDGVLQKSSTESFIGHQSYVMVSRNYQVFLESLNEAYTTNVITNSFLYQKDDTMKEERGFEVISYRERSDVARKIHMNALLGGGHNHVQQKDMDSYRYWTVASKFNQLLSFIMYDRAVSGG